MTESVKEFIWFVWWLASNPQTIWTNWLEVPWVCL